MAIIRWDPFRDLMNLQEKMNRLFEDGLAPRQEMFYSGSWIPAVDIYETDVEFVAKAELPGLEAKDIKVELKENLLYIEGERRLERGMKEENYHRIERSYGRFQRAFTLPADVVCDDVKAIFEDGVLEVHLPKSEESEPKQIKVKIT